MGAIYSLSDCLSVFIFLLTVISGRGEREDFKIHLKVIKLALGPLTRAGLSLQWPAAPRGGEVGCPGKLGTGRYLCAPRPRWGALSSAFSRSSDTGQKHCLAAKGSSLRLLLGCLQRPRAHPFASVFSLDWGQPFLLESSGPAFPAPLCVPVAGWSSLV